MKKKTKEDLLKENAQLIEKLEVALLADRSIRENLTSVLLYLPKVYNSISSIKPATMSWIDIAFNMGELRADADYSMLLEGREMMRREIEELKRQLNPLPEKH